MSGRDAIFTKLRKSLDVRENDDTRRETVRQRLEASPKGLIPKRGQLPDAARVDLFCQMAGAVQTTVRRVGNADAVPQAVADALHEHNHPATIRMGDDIRLRALPWAKLPALSVLSGRSHGDDAATLSHAIAGIAETGTLVLQSGQDNPTTLNFLPETHIVVIEAADIAGDMEAIWTQVRTEHGKGAMPRIVNMITGPSRSADIEQKLILGAHGPRSLHIIVVDGASNPR